MHAASSVTHHDGRIAITPAMPHMRPPGMGAPLLLMPATSALVLVDVQHFFLSTPPFTTMQAVVAPLARLLPVARAAGITIVHVRTEFDPLFTDLGRPGSRTRQMLDSVAAGLVAGSEGAAPPPQLVERPGDVLVIKHRFSGFWGTTLDQELRDRGIETLMFAGGTTTVCVESTLRDAVFLEYNPLLLTDCVQDISPELHESAVQRVDLFFGWTCASDVLAAALQPIERQLATRKPSVMADAER